MNLFYTFLFLLYFTCLANARQFRVTDQVYLDFHKEDKYVGRVVIGLFGDLAPKAVKNFKVLAAKGIKGKSYKGTSINRIIKRFMVQGGDVVSDDGLGSISIYGETFDDENLDTQHSMAGFVSMANKGKNTNGCQFFITTTGTPWLDGLHTVVGKVVEGQNIVHILEHTPVDVDDRPTVRVYIKDSGLLPTTPFYVSDDPYEVCMSGMVAGCVRGVCVMPDVCRCDFGYVGANCTIQCQCNGHSHCEGPDKLDKCIECHNNTMGNQCEKCKPNFVGDPTDNGQCIPCSSFCHGHTSICTNDQDSVTSRDTSTDIEDYYREGATRARCVRCANNTDGSRCERCIEGYFRGSEDFRDPCRPCECHGHGDTCDPVTGEKCNCGNNTESDVTCQTSSSSKNSAQECWRHQCVKCKEFYMGDPRNGHQCYKTINIENKLCFDGKSIDECKIKPRPLYPGQTVFVAINPRYMNVDIRVIVDVTQGAVDLYLSPNDSSFVVSVNASNGAHDVQLDPTYYKHEPFRKMPSFDDHIPDKPRLTWYYDKVEYTLADYFAKDLATYVTVDRKNIMLRVRNLRNRLVLTLPENVHVLMHTRFYIIIRARNAYDGAASFGITFFRQDQLHIDLFVFFSVFFSCFFLFLAACVVAWKAKQAADMRRARRRHVVEMLHMANRPFAAVTLVLSGALPTSAGARRRRGADLRPVAIEPTADGRAAVTSVVVRLPGGSNAPVRLALASSLVLVSRGGGARPRARRLHARVHT